MSPRAFDRVMVAMHIGSHPKFARLSNNELLCFITGVLPVAQQSLFRGTLTVGDQPATPEDISAQTGRRSSAAVVRSTIQKLLDVGVLFEDEEIGALRVHDFDDWNPAPKVDRTNAERQRRFRERHAASNGVTDSPSNAVTNGTVTPPEVEGEVEGSSLRSDNARGARSSSRNGILAPKDEPIGFSEWVGYHAEHSGRTVPRAGTSHRSQLARTFAALLAEGFTLDDFKLASDGVLADQWKRDNGHDKFETVLRKTKFGELVEDGRRARTPHLRPVPNGQRSGQEWRRLLDSTEPAGGVA